MGVKIGDSTIPTSISEAGDLVLSIVGSVVYDEEVFLHEMRKIEKEVEKGSANIGMKSSALRKQVNRLPLSNKDKAETAEIYRLLASNGAAVGENYRYLGGIGKDWIDKHGGKPGKVADDLTLMMKNPQKGLSLLEQRGFDVSSIVPRVDHLVEKGKILEAQRAIIDLLDKQLKGSVTKYLKEYESTFIEETTDTRGVAHGIIQNPGKAAFNPHQISDPMGQAQAKLKIAINEGDQQQVENLKKIIRNIEKRKEDAKLQEEEANRAYTTEWLKQKADTHGKWLERQQLEGVGVKRAGADYIPEYVSDEVAAGKSSKQKVNKSKTENEVPRLDSCSCPFVGKNIEDICFTCKCDCSEKKDTPAETQPTSLKKEAGALDSDANTRGLSLGTSMGSPMVSSLMPMEGPFGGAFGLGEDSGFNLSEIMNGGIDEWIGDFGRLGDSAKSIFKDMGMDLSSIFKDGGISLDGFFGKLDGLMQNNPFGKMLGGLFGGQGGGFDLGGMLGGLFGGGGAGGGMFGNILSSIGGMFGGGGGMGGMMGGGGGWMSMAGSIISSFFHDGGFVGGPGRSQLVPAALFAGAPRFHSGGFLGPGERPIIAKDGELILNAAQQRNVAGNMNGGVNVTVPVIVENHSKEKVQSQEEAGPDGKKQIRMLIGDAVNKGISSGQFDTSMNRAYGLSRKGY